MPIRSMALSGLFLSLILSTCLGTPMPIGKSNKPPEASSSIAPGPSSAAPQPETGHLYSVTQTPDGDEPSSLRLRATSGEYVPAVENHYVIYVNSEKAEEDGRIYVLAWDMASTPYIDEHDLDLFPLPEALSKDYAYKNIKVVLATVKLQDLDLSTGVKTLSNSVAKMVWSAMYLRATKKRRRASTSSDSEFDPGQNKQPVRSAASAKSPKQPPAAKKPRRKPTSSDDECGDQNSEVESDQGSEPVTRAGLQISEIREGWCYLVNRRFVRVRQLAGGHRHLSGADGERRLIYLGKGPASDKFLLEGPITEADKVDLCLVKGKYINQKDSQFILAEVEENAWFYGAKELYDPAQIQTLKQHAEVFSNGGQGVVEAGHTPGLSSYVDGDKVEVLTNEGNWESFAVNRKRRILCLGTAPYPFVMQQENREKNRAAIAGFVHFTILGKLFTPVRFKPGATFEPIEGKTDDLEEINNLVNPCDVSSNSGDSSA